MPCESLEYVVKQNYVDGPFKSLLAAVLVFELNSVLKQFISIKMFLGFIQKLALRAPSNKSFVKETKISLILFAAKFLYSMG